MDTLLGKAIPVPEQYDPTILRSIPVRPMEDMETEVVLEFSDFTSMCPVTGQPDFGKVQIRYIPENVYIESKSLKLYLASFRNYKCFQEDITRVIARDICDVLGVPVTVSTSFVARGSVSICTEASAQPISKKEQ